MKKHTAVFTSISILFFSLITYSTISTAKARFYITNSNDFKIWVKCVGPTLHVSPKATIGAHKTRINFYTPRLDIGLHGRWSCTVCPLTKKGFCATKQFEYCVTETTEIDIYVKKNKNRVTITYGGAVCG